ncbi:hypothetical protein BDQ94DRAFT_145991 [Aspergillus welwitschiae]|uniref:Uncharacterized protein n=1 Tax=Aspergillus welwitschiae TaxID=1341132 RepID=A0A3F3PY59_9EURO|nr:hypothetical protein BDQ94DRAFT_145991 [Aspergillus welwitschiae]RDH31900.1 hypothetical protein BDQ94DRAFT_145991 [Aspergillus welwitschiae]
MKITIHVCSHGNDSAQQLADILVEDKSGIFKKPDSNDTSVVTMASPYRLGMPVNVEITASRARRETHPGYTPDMRIFQDAFETEDKSLDELEGNVFIPFLPLEHVVLLEMVQPSCSADTVWRLASRLKPGHRWSENLQKVIEDILKNFVDSQERGWWGKRSKEQWEEHLRIVDSGSHVASPS